MLNIYFKFLILYLSIFSLINIINILQILKTNTQSHKGRPTCKSEEIIIPPSLFLTFAPQF